MKKTETLRIDGNEIMLNRSGKVNKADGVVYSGCGIHKDKKTYTRKKKHKKEKEKV